MAKKTKTLTFRHPDRILPHLGTLFGLTEEATVVVLIDMGLLEKRATGVTQICQQQWEHLRDFHQLRGVLEWGNSQLAGQRLMYIQIGFISQSPAQIYQRYKKPKERMAPPTRFGSRAINKFVTQKLSLILKDSAVLDTILLSTTTSEKSPPGEDNSEIDSDTDSKVNVVKPMWSVWEGEVASEIEFPVLHAFGIPVDNPETTQLLLQELAKL